MSSFFAMTTSGRRIAGRGRRRRTG